MTSPAPRVEAPLCRACKAPLVHAFLDLGKTPLCQKHLAYEQLSQMEPFYPLKVWLCTACYLAQIEEIVSPDEIFGDGEYAYFSSYSDSWLAHAEAYVSSISERLGLGEQSFVVEVASNDGYLLQYFSARGIRALGIDPAANAAAAATERGVETWVRFFGEETATEVLARSGPADLIAANNVLAHVPDINDFVCGLSVLLAERGVATLEFPHLMRLIEGNQFDTIYHEHFSYLSLLAVENLFSAHGLRVFDVEELGTHGGSLRIYVERSDASARPVAERVVALRQEEEAKGLRSLEYYERFEERVHGTKRDLLEFLIDAKRRGKTIAGYGAPGKGNTLLNYCGIRTDFLDYTVDRSPHKQGGYLPGTHIPIRAPEEIARTKPDYLLILPWNLRDEISTQMSFIREWGGQFVVPIPDLEIWK